VTAIPVPGKSGGRYRIRKALEFQIEFLFPLTHSRKLCFQAGILLAQGFFHLRDGIIDHLSLAWTIASSSLSGLARVRPRLLSMKSFEKVQFQLADFAVGGNGLAVVDEGVAEASTSGPLRYAS